MNLIMSVRLVAVKISYVKTCILDTRINIEAGICKFKMFANFYWEYLQAQTYSNSFSVEQKLIFKSIIVQSQWFYSVHLHKQNEF